MGFPAQEGHSGQISGALGPWPSQFLPGWGTLGVERLFKTLQVFLSKAGDFGLGTGLLGN